jgi:ornithine cyclodeaminase/alanine dehydrogenase-like protein (mu-crystallin family)
MRSELDLDVVAVQTPEQAVKQADVITITAASYKPVFAASDVQAGALVTSIAGRAVPPELQSRSRIVVPSLIGPEHHASGWDPFPFQLNGGRDASTVATTLVDMLRQKSSARLNESDIVFYEQSGSFAWDGAMTRWLYDWAVAERRGTTFSISE